MSACTPFCPNTQCWQRAPCALHQEMTMREEGGMNTFEWMADFRVLTAAGVLSREFLCGERAPPKRVLVPGCGRSLLGVAFGRLACESWGYCVEVIETDIEPDVIQCMQPFARQNCSTCRHRFEIEDILTAQISEEFDLVIDKGTFDALLCVGRGADYMLKLAEGLIEGGAILLLSLHEPDFIRPLLQDSGLPFCIERTREAVWGSQNINILSVTHSKTDLRAASPEHALAICYVYLLRKSSEECNPEKVISHFLCVQDHWFQELSPLLTNEREAQLRKSFGSKACSLVECYELLFTNAEREMLTFSDFMEDFDSFRSKNDFICDSMNIDQALEFLKTMQ